MKVLLDTNFIRHLNLLNQIGSISVVSNQFGWEFVVPETVIDELRVRTIPAQLQNLIHDQIITMKYCTDQEISASPSIILGLDDGELEAICIINKCEDRTFRSYLLLTSDVQAQRKASSLGINSLDIVTFIFFLNQKGLFHRTTAIAALPILEQTGYRIEENVKSDFLRRLV